MLRLPVALHVPVAGSYSSALLRKLTPLNPPATSTLPLGNNVAVCARRAVLRLLVALQVPVAGSYSSALASSPPLNPPATSTLPLGNNVAVCTKSAVLRLPLAL